MSQDETQQPPMQPTMPQSASLANEIAAAFFEREEWQELRDWLSSNDDDQRRYYLVRDLVREQIDALAALLEMGTAELSKVTQQGNMLVAVNRIQAQALGNISAVNGKLVDPTIAHWLRYVDAEASKLIRPAA